MLRNLREFWRRRVTDRDGRLRKEDRRKEELPFEGPDRRRGKDRREYVRRVMTGEVPLPDEQRRTPR